MDEWSGLEFFQFDNLIRGRVPFHVLNLGVNFDTLYPIAKLPVERLQLRNREIVIAVAGASGAAEQLALAEIQQQKIAKQDPIIVACSNGLLSEKVASLLSSDGYANVYYLKGGLEEMLSQSTEGLV